MSKKVLIVEDDVTLQGLLVERLKAAGIEAMGVETGVAALGEAQKNVPDLVVLDIMLPGGMNGFDVLEQIKKDPRLKDIPVVVLTNLDSEEKVALSIGAADYIIKTKISLDDVIKRVRARLEASSDVKPN